MFYRLINLGAEQNYTVGLGFDIILNIVHGGQSQWHILGERGGLQPPGKLTSPDNGQLICYTLFTCFLFLITRIWLVFFDLRSLKALPDFCRHITISFFKFNWNLTYCNLNSGSQILNKTRQHCKLNSLKKTLGYLLLKNLSLFLLVYLTFLGIA